jgi:hypothetical protein
VPRPTRGQQRVLPVRGCHPLWPGVPAGSGSDAAATGLVRVRSPLLTESRLMSFPPGTEMFQFPGFASPAYRFSGRYPIAGVGCPIRRSPDHSLLAASRGLSQRATSFIASWRQGIHQMPLLSSPPASDNRTPAARPTVGRNGGDGRAGRRPVQRPSSHNHRAAPRRAARIPMPQTRPARRRNSNGGARDLPAPAARTTHGRDRSRHARATGTSSPPYDVQTASGPRRAAGRTRPRRHGAPGGPGPT